MDILVIDNLVKIYGRGSNHTKAVDGVSFSVKKSEFVTIMGASGSGKTTLLNLIATIDTVSGGSIRMEGEDITTLGEERLADYRADKLGFIFQEYNLLDTLTVFENVMLPLSLKGLPQVEIIDRTKYMLGIFGIEHLTGKFPSEISGGERQRTACARALITNPALILADEPTGALDSKNSMVLMRLLRMMNEQHGSTILTVTHDPVVAAYAGRVLILKDGRLQNELRKGEKTYENFYSEILTVHAAAGGGHAW